MSRFKVRVRAWSGVSTVIEVDAKSRAEAEELAMDRVEQAEEALAWSEEPSIRLEAATIGEVKP